MKSLKRVICLILAILILLSNTIISISAVESDESQTEETTTVSSKKLLYRYRKKQYAYTYHIDSSSYYSDWTVYKKEAINERIKTLYNVVPTDIGGKSLLEWKDTYPIPDFSIELKELDLPYNYGYVYNKRQDGSGYNYYLTYPLSSTNGVGSKCYYNDIVGYVYYVGTVSKLYDFFLYAKNKYYVCKWGDWSEWSETPVVANDEIEVETKETNVLYRSKKKIYTTSETTLGDPWTLYNTATEYEHSGFSSVMLNSNEKLDESYCVHKKESVSRYRTERGQYVYLTSDEYLNYILNHGNLESAFDGYKYEYTYCTSKKPYTVYYYYMWGSWSEWSYNPVTENDDTIVETKYATIYITYDANGGTGAPEAMTKEYDEPIKLSETVPTRENHQFLGWSTSLDGTVEYAPGAEFSENIDVTLFAVWKNVTEYNITFDANGGTGCPDGQIKIHDEALILSDVASVRKGFTFIGWSQDKNSKIAEYVPGGEFNVNGDTTLYAVWEKGCDEPHYYVETIVEPSCNYEGFTMHICVYCNHTYSDNYVEPIDHIAEIQNYTAPTCENNGYSGDTVCTVCSAVIANGVVIPTTGHDYSATVIAPTCTEEGYTENCCSNCADTYKDNFVDIIAHCYIGSVLKSPTANAKGVLEASCESCGDYVTAVLPVLSGESYSIMEQSSPSCEEEGIVVYTLKDMIYGEIKIEVVTESAGHSYDAVLVSPSCTEKGYTEYTCTNCGDNYVGDVTEALGHSFDGGACTVCGEASTDDGVIGDGDINGDGIINAMDTNVMKRIVAGQLMVSDEALLAADINGDGNVNSIDANLLVKRIAGGK